MGSWPIEFRRLQRDSHDACSRCAKAFTNGVTVTVGYSADRTALRAGDCCAQLVEQVAEKIRWEPLDYEVPPSNARLWRYLDFAKFVAMLHSAALHFSRIDLLGDRFELAKGLRQRKHLLDAHYLSEYRKILQNPPPGVDWHFSAEELNSQAMRLLRETSEIAEIQRNEIFVSCWHENDGESEALWRLYCGTSAGVAIQVRYREMLDALRDQPDIAVGRVEYVDFSRDFAGVNDAVFRKRMSLSHEREVRAVHYYFGDDSPPGINIPVGIARLIERVVVSPFAPEWFKNVTEETITRFGYALRVETSELLAEPFF